MSKPTKIPGIPKTPASVDRNTASLLTNLTEAVEIRLGRRGDPKDRAVTLRELIDSGLAKDLKASPWDPNNPTNGNRGFEPNAVIDLNKPPVPQNFEANGAYSQVNLSWDYPYYSNHSFTEIYGHDSDVIGDAQLIGVSSGRVYIDPIGSGQTRFYWIRFVSQSNIIGDFNSGTGTEGTTATDVDNLITTLSGAITTSELATSLSTPIGNLPTNTVSQISSLQNQINTLSTVAAWATGTVYAANDLVTYSGKLYEAASAHTASASNQPSGDTSDNTTWTFVGEYTSLASAVAGNTSDITDINFIDATSSSASAQKLATLESTVTDPTTGLAATRSTLTTNYYTKTDADTAISTAVTGLASETYVGTELGSYTTSADLVTNYYTKTGADSAISTAITTAQSGFSNPDGSSGTVTLQQALTTQADVNGDLKGQYSVKIDNNGHVTGFGLSSTTTTAGPTSAFIVRADRFAVIDPASTADGLGTTAPAADNVPFFIDSGTTYIKSAAIKDASITSAKIGSVNANTINAGTLSADRIGANSIEASKLLIDNNYLAESATGELILRTVTTNDGSGVKYENLSFDAVGVIAQGLQSGNLTMSNQSYAASNFTQATPYSEYYVPGPYGGEGTTITLPVLLELNIPASQLKESGYYFFDYGAQPFGSLPNNSTTSSSMIVLDVLRKSTSASTYSYYATRRGTLTSNGSLPLTYRNGSARIYIDHTQDHKFKLFGYIKGFNDDATTSSKGMYEGYVRVFKIHKST